MKHLHVFPRSGRVPVFEASPTAARRQVGYEHDPNAGPNGGWVVLEEPQKVPFCTETHPDFRSFWSEYRGAVREGSLWPADVETARECGVSFDPHFGKGAPEAPVKESAAPSPPAPVAEPSAQPASESPAPSDASAPSNAPEAPEVAKKDEA